MDAITLLKDDHKAVEKLFKRYEKAGDRAYAEKREVVDRIIEELSVHAAVEEQLFYPVTRATVPQVEDVALESLEEHHIVKWVLSELQGMDPKDERFDAKVSVLMENVRHHVHEEEDDYFPKVRDELGRAALNDLGEAMEAAKAVAPTHPHPRAPDTPPGNLIVGPAAGAVDRVGDTVKRILGRTADKVQATGADATEAVIEAVREAKQSAKNGAKRTTGSAKRTTKTTAKRARTAAKRATTTAKRATTTAKRTSTTAKRTATKRATAATRTIAKRTPAKRGAATRARTTAKRTTAKARRR
jgi:hemerythrin superfamily protein